MNTVFDYNDKMSLADFEVINWHKDRQKEYEQALESTKPQITPIDLGKSYHKKALDYIEGLPSHVVQSDEILTLNEYEAILFLFNLNYSIMYLSGYKLPLDVDVVDKFVTLLNEYKELNEEDELEFDLIFDDNKALVERQLVSCNRMVQDFLEMSEHNEKKK